MDRPRNRTPQQMPEEFAERLRAMRRDRDQRERFNAVLAAARHRGWHTATLAEALDSTPDAVSKRIERAAPADISGVVIPEPIWVAEDQRLSPVRPQTMMNGHRLPQEKIDELRAMRQVASRVNGATPVDAEERQVSERFSAELNALINHPDPGQRVTAYYLAKVLGTNDRPLTHRAIVARLERHGYRRPAPSVADTASGRYRNRRVGDPPENLVEAGQGAT